MGMAVDVSGNFMALALRALLFRMISMFLNLFIIFVAFSFFCPYTHMTCSYPVEILANWA
jgi:hypothetical protein